MLEFLKISFIYFLVLSSQLQISRELQRSKRKVDCGDHKYTGKKVFIPNVCSWLGESLCKF